jgi:hypothetical protein
MFSLPFTFFIFQLAPAAGFVLLDVFFMVGDVVLRLPSLTSQ